MEAEDVIQGTVEKVIFLNESNGYTVAALKPEGLSALLESLGQRRDAYSSTGELADLEQSGQATIVGTLPGISEGEVVRCVGRWVVNDRFGLQFQVEFYESVVPSTEEGLRKYLSSGVVPSIGKKFAKRLVDRFGMELVNVIENEPERLREVHGFGTRRIAVLREAWEEQRQVRRIMVFLHSHGIGTLLALKIYKKYGNNSVQVVQQNPYILALEISGIGFVRADRIAQSLGFRMDSLERAEAGIAYVLEQGAMAEGHCLLPLRELVSRAAELLEVDTWVVAQGLNRLLETRLAILENIDQSREVRLEDLAEQGSSLAQLIEEEEEDAPEHAVYSRSLLWAERDVAAKLTALKSAESSMPSIKIEEAIQWAEQTVAITLSEEQREASPGGRAPAKPP
jgi:exodeoxyribonuclease V alpha subunit